MHQPAKIDKAKVRARRPAYTPDPAAMTYQMALTGSSSCRVSVKNFSATASRVGIRIAHYAGLRVGTDSCTDLADKSCDS